MPTISIGMPVYNGERFLEEALRSILAQTYDDFELIISDNASTDQTVEIIERVAAGDPRVILKRNPENVGAAPNYNVLVELSRGKYFKWAAHDDNLAPTYLERCVGELEQRSDCVLCYPSTVMIDASGTPTGSDPMDALDVLAATPHKRFASYMAAAWPQLGCNAVFGVIRTDDLRSTRLIGGYASSDKILLGELAMLGKFSQLPEKLFFRREHAGSSVRANPGVAERNLWFDASEDTGPGFVRWRWVGEYLKGIHHLPISIREKIRCQGVMWEHIKWDQDRLQAELKRPVKRLIRGTAK